MREMEGKHLFFIGNPVPIDFCGIDSCNPSIYS